ncbi:MAG: DUF6600 domain-containing protein [Chthoniobacterales bacterium]
MKTLRVHLLALLIFTLVAETRAGTVSYVAVSPVQSDVSCGISNEFQYTSAVDAGNASGTPRVINGITLSPLVGAGQSATADSCTLNALAGTLANVSEPDPSTLAADGSFKEVVADMTVNDGAPDNSEQEIVLDPASLIAGTAYDLRIYIANAGSPDREVNLSFVGDGQPAVETGFFNEDDARTSPGHFQERNQVYYIDYRFTWDGSSTPGVTVKQQSGQAPFSFYALTNQPVAETAAAGVAAAPELTAAPVLREAGAAGVRMGLVNARADHVGVASETFYGNESLKKHGRWIDVKKYGRAWQPTDAPSDWRPYSRGHFVHSREGGYTWVSDVSESDWGWATYHYGRWCRVPGVGSGWAWVPGTVWGGAWVSWRQGHARDDSYVGWAPLPPEAICRVGVGISSWADREYDIGPDYYSFVHVRDFGSDDYGRVILNRQENIGIIEHTVNITNISYTSANFGGRNSGNVNVASVTVYNGGPDFQSFNAQIRQRGGREIQQIQINRVGAANFAGSRGSQLQGNTLVVFTPQVTAQANPKLLPNIAATVPDNKIDHGWAEVKDPKVKSNLQNVIAGQTQGRTPLTTKAVLPPEVVREATQPTAGPSASPATTSSSPGQTAAGPSPSAISPTPAAGSSPSTAPIAGTSPSASATATIPAAGVKGQHPGDAVGTTTASAAPTATASSSTEAKTLHPGAKVTPAVAGSPVTAAPSPAVTPQATVTTLGQHPGTKVRPEAAKSPASTAAPSSPAITASVTPAPSVPPQPTAIAKSLHPGSKVIPEATRSPAMNGTSTASPSAIPQPPVVKGQHPGSKIAPAVGQSPAAASPTSSPEASTSATAQPIDGEKGQHPRAGIAPTKPPLSGNSSATAITPAPVSTPEVGAKGQHSGNKVTPVRESSPAVGEPTTTPALAHATESSSAGKAQHPGAASATTPQPRSRETTPSSSASPEARPSAKGGKSPHPTQKEPKSELTPAPTTQQHPAADRGSGAPMPSKSGSTFSSPAPSREQQRESATSESMPKQTPRAQEHTAASKPARTEPSRQHVQPEAQRNETQPTQERITHPQTPARAVEQKAEQIERKQPHAGPTPESQTPKEQPQRRSTASEPSLKAAEQKAEQAERRKQPTTQQNEQGQRSQQPSSIPQQRHSSQQESQAEPGVQQRQEQNERRQTKPAAIRESQPSSEPQKPRPQPQESQPRQNLTRGEAPEAQRATEPRQPSQNSSQAKPQQGSRASPTPTPHQ